MNSFLHGQRLQSHRWLSKRCFIVQSSDSFSIPTETVERNVGKKTTEGENQ